jgi:hypothetical protein
MEVDILLSMAQCSAEICHKFGVFGDNTYDKMCYTKPYLRFIIVYIQKKLCPARQSFDNFL